jgi:hypothetical protein
VFDAELATQPNAQTPGNVEGRSFTWWTEIEQHILRRGRRIGVSARWGEDYDHDVFKTFRAVDHTGE